MAVKDCFCSVEMRDRDGEAGWTPCPCCGAGYDSPCRRGHEGPKGSKNPDDDIMHEETMRIEARVAWVEERGAGDELLQHEIWKDVFLHALYSGTGVRQAANEADRVLTDLKVWVNTEAK